jgi:hypothetical protein
MTVDTENEFVSRSLNSTLLVTGYLPERLGNTNRASNSTRLEAILLNHQNGSFNSRFFIGNQCSLNTIVDS